MTLCTVRRLWAAAGILGILGGFAAPAAAESLSGNGSLFGSERSYREGDLVTVVIAESAEGVQSASTDLNKSTSLGVTTGGVLAAVPDANLGVSTALKGGGNLGRKGRLTATVTTQVRKILENGNLSLAGEQDIEFDAGRQHISVLGVARPRDISSTNEIYSYRLADAKIEFNGKGALNEKARAGVLGRFLEWLWIF